MTPPECPNEATLSRLVRGELDEGEHETIASHVRSCRSCCTMLDEISTGWNLPCWPPGPADLSTRTRAIQARLAAAPPSQAGSGSLSAALPGRIPVIPGLGTLQPRARGGMGVVYRALDLTLHRPVAVKVLWPAVAGSATVWARAKRESLLLARISHANVVGLYAAGETDGTPYLVMEWVDGPSLEQRLRSGLPSPRQAARIVRDLARALATVHAHGIIHRDIKPDNVLLAGADADDWDRCVPKLADFGLARAADESQQLTQNTAALGTPAYMAPEQTGLAPELGEAGPATDVHGLGGLAFALLTGRPPFEGAATAGAVERAARGEVAWPPESRRLPRDLRAVVEKCLEREPVRRFGTAAEVADDLHRFCEGLPVHARPVSPLRRLGRTIRRRPGAAVAVGLSVAFAVAALVGVSFHEAQLATATTRILRSERLAEQTAGVAARSLGRTGLLLEQMIRQSRPDDSTNLELLRQVREEFFHFPLRDDPIDSLRSRVHGLCRVADVMCESKHYEDALACHAMTLEVLDELTTRQPTDAQATVERLHVMHMQRVCLHRLGRMHEAADAARRSLELIERTSADLPDREREIIRAKLDLGVFLNEIRQHDEAAENLDEAFVRLRALRENRPGEISLAEQQAHALLSAVMGAANAGRPEECRRWSEQLTCEISDFLATAPTDSLSIAQRSQLTKMAGVGFSQLARLAYESGDEDEAIFLLEKQRQLCLAFVATLPPGKVDPVHNELVDAEMQTASLLAERGWGERAQAAVDRAGKTAAFLLDRQPGVWDHAALQARVFQGEAELATARGDRAVAGDRYAKIIALMEPHLANPTCRGATEALLRSARDGLLDLTENRPAHSENSSPP